MKECGGPINGSTTTAIVRAAWTPGRAKPTHRSEMVTQWLCGERLTVEETTEEGAGSPDGGNGWLRVTGPDGYTSWVDGGGLLRVDAAAAGRWEQEADRISLGTELRPAASESEAREGEAGERPAPSPSGAVPRFLPWGARVAASEEPAGEAGQGQGEHAGPRVRLPDGEEAEATDPDRLVAREECVLRFPPRANAVLATASAWTGVPYLWGGRTREGVDCSGFVQAVLALHGRRLPRDSDLQLRADEPVWRRAAAGDRGRSARGEGPGEAGDNDMAGKRGGSATDLLALAREVLRPGDLLFFGEGTDFGMGADFGENAEFAARNDVGENAERVTHVAFHAEGTRILHAAAGRGQVTRDDLAADDPLMERLRGRFLAVTRPLARVDEESGG